MYLKIEGLDKLEQAAIRIGELLSIEALEAEVNFIANQAGEALLQSSIRACMEAVYDFPEMTYERTMALLDSHIRAEVTVGPLYFEQLIGIDPDADAQGDVHSGREKVVDYASYVHDGYTQWVWGHETGIFQPGKFWFDVALEEAYPVVYGYVRQAFINCIERVIKEVVL